MPIAGQRHERTAPRSIAVSGWALFPYDRVSLGSGLAYRRSMSPPEKFAVERRPEREFLGCWGIRSLTDGTWLPVVYSNQAEAKAAARAIR